MYDELSARNTCNVAIPLQYGETCPVFDTLPLYGTTPLAYVDYSVEYNSTAGNVDMNEYSSFKAPLSTSGSSNTIDGYHSFMQFHDLAGTSNSEFYSPPLQVKGRMYKCVRMKCASFLNFIFLDCVQALLFFNY